MVWQVRENPQNQNCNFELNRNNAAENQNIQQENSRETTKSPSPFLNQTGSSSYKTEVGSRTSTTSRISSTSSVELGPAPGSGLVTADASDVASAGEDIPDSDEPEVAKRKSNLDQHQEENACETTLPVPSENNNVDNLATSTDLGLEMTESMTASTLTASSLTTSGLTTSGLTASSLMQFNRDIESMMDHSEAGALEPKEDFTGNLS